MINYNLSDYSFVPKTEVISPPPYTRDDIKLIESYHDESSMTFRLLFQTPKGKFGVSYEKEYIYNLGGKGKTVLGLATTAVLAKLNEGVSKDQWEQKNAQWEQEFLSKKVQWQSVTATAGTNPVIKSLRDGIPGLAKARAACPCRKPACLYGIDTAVVTIVMHLNDAAKWSRERIADWLDTLDVDLRFQPPTEGNQDGDSDQE